MTTQAYSEPLPSFISPTRASWAVPQGRRAIYVYRCRYATLPDLWDEHGQTRGSKIFEDTHHAGFWECHTGVLFVMLQREPWPGGFKIPTEDGDNELEP